MSDRSPIALRLDEAELVACVGCGLCLPHCPTYRVTGEEIASPRGRIAAMRAVSEGRAPLDAAFTEAMDACIQCRGCEAACPSGVQFGHLMEDTRTALEPRRRWTRRLAEAVAFRGLLPHRRALGAATRALAVGQRLHLVPARARAAEAPDPPVRASDRRRASRRLPVHGLCHGRVAARRPPCRAARRCAPRGHVWGWAGRAATAAARCTPMPAGAPTPSASPNVSSTRFPVTRR